MRVGGLAERTNDTAGIAHGQAHRGDALGDDTTRTDDGASADGYAGEDRTATADPDMILDDDRDAKLLAGSPLLEVERMPHTVERHGGSDEHMVAYGNMSAIEHGAATIDEGMTPYLNLAPIVAKEWGHQPTLLA